MTRCTRLPLSRGYLARDTECVRTMRARARNLCIAETPGQLYVRLGQPSAAMLKARRGIKVTPMYVQYIPYDDEEC